MPRTIQPEPCAGSAASASAICPAARGLGEDEARRRADRGVGEGGQRRGHLDDVPDAAEIGERRRAAPPPAAPRAERRHQLGRVAAFQAAAASARSARRMRAVGIGVEQIASQPAGIVERSSRAGRASSRMTAARNGASAARRQRARRTAAPASPLRGRAVSAARRALRRARRAAGLRRGCDAAQRASLLSAPRLAGRLGIAIRSPGGQSIGRRHGHDEARACRRRVRCVAMVQARDRRDEAEAEAAAGLRAALLQADEALQHALAILGGMPGPLSATATTIAVAARARVDMAIARPSPPASALREYLMALSTRLASAWPSSSRLPVSGDRPRASDAERRPRSPRRPARRARRRRATIARDVDLGSCAPSGEPASRRAIISSALKVWISWSASSIVASSAAR